MEERDSTKPDFWSHRYAVGRTPWQMDHVPEQLRVFLQSLEPGRRVLIPGCGEDFRAIEAFHRAGHQVTGIDFSPVAVESIKKTLPKVSGAIVLGDLFSYNFGAASFDLVYERSFLCSLPPRLWNDYVARVAQLLVPHGMLAGFFFYGNDPDPPPYPLTEAKASELFGGHFNLRKSAEVTDSLPIYDRNEKWLEWQLR